LHVVGRNDDIIISGGEKLRAHEIEDSARCYPAVTDAAVVALPSKRWGQRPLLVVEPHSVDLDGLLTHLRNALPKIALPDRIIRVTELPRTALGKISRADILALAESLSEDET
jgi:fatty-acyl-CoA synthase